MMGGCYSGRNVSHQALLGLLAVGLLLSKHLYTETGYNFLLQFA